MIVLDTNVVSELFRKEPDPGAGIPIATADAQIAAICRARGMMCATRNPKDFVKTGVRVVNPWRSARS